MTGKKRKLLKCGAAVVAISLVAALLFILAVSKLCLVGTFNRQEARDDVTRTTMYTADDFDKYEKQKIRFLSGRNMLKGYIWGDKSSKKLVVISHGWGELSNYYYPVMDYFVSRGYRVLTYDNTGTGESEGFGTKGLSQSAIDLDNALSFIERDGELRKMPVYLFGHSWGGHAVTSVLNFGHKNVRAVASVAGYNSNGGAMLEWMQRRLNMGAFAYSLFPFAAFWSLLDAGENYYATGVSGINNANLPVLVVQGGNDDTVLEDSIYSHRKEITNDSVEYYYIEKGTHTDVIESNEASTRTYRELIDYEYEKLSKKYDGNIPEDVEAKFINSVNKQKYNEVNNNTMSKVFEFFEAI